MGWLLIALGIDNVGSGLFLPLTVVYATRVVGLPLGVAGVTVTVGTLVGLLVPPVAGRLVDRIGPKPVVVASQALQAAGTLVFFVAGGVASVAVAVCLLAAGQQLFYSSLFALLSDVVGDRPKDRPFAVATMVRSGTFGLGGLLAAWLLSIDALRAAVLVNAVSFVVCGALLTVFVHAPHTRVVTTERGRVSQRFLAVVVVTGLVAFAGDFFLVGIPVYVLDLGTPTWLPGVILALHTAVSSTCATLAVRLTDHLARTTTLALSSGLVVVWCGLCLAAAGLPSGWRTAWLLGAGLVLAMSGVLFGSRVNALAVALAPDESRGRHLAAFQYAFTVPVVLAPAVVALFDTAVWLPWAVTAVTAVAGGMGMLSFGTRLPADAVRPASGPAR